MVLESLILYGVLGVLFVLAVILSLARARSGQKKHPASVDVARDAQPRTAPGRLDKAA
jgi:hypothetical protein